MWTTWNNKVDTAAVILNPNIFIDVSVIKMAAPYIAKSLKGQYRHDQQGMESEC